MDPKSDFDMEEMIEMSEGLGRKRKKTGIGIPSYLVIGVIVIVCLVLVFALFFNSGGKASSERINAISSRLDQLEGKVQQDAETENRVGQLEIQIQALLDAISRIEENVKSHGQALGTMEKQMGLLKSRIASVSTKTRTRAGGQMKTLSQTQNNYHVVQRGETLFGIAKKHGLSVNELISMNHFSKDTKIYPGQKILVK